MHRENLWSPKGNTGKEQAFKWLLAIGILIAATGIAVTVAAYVIAVANENTFEALDLSFSSGNSSLVTSCMECDAGPSPPLLSFFEKVDTGPKAHSQVQFSGTGLRIAEMEFPKSESSTNRARIMCSDLLNPTTVNTQRESGTACNTCFAPCLPSWMDQQVKARIPLEAAPGVQVVFGQNSYSLVVGSMPGLVNTFRVGQQNFISGPTGCSIENSGIVGLGMGNAANTVGNPTKFPSIRACICINDPQNGNTPISFCTIQKGVQEMSLQKHHNFYKVQLIKLLTYIYSKLGYTKTCPYTYHIYLH